ncbi:MAG: hypothetical protein KF730_08530 [Sphingomonas sp.]|uniref:hypothetical protein n=1 Tax=Sphingomonas sp. TaxID=28214 RepID=UPI0025D261C8|nr:hypothetical protein [Sphingomonas sp.]MBX3564605.1 hypothetical protein [Sphingomonas sp.]
MKTLPLTTLAAALALAACNGAPETTDNAAVNVSDATAIDNIAEDEAPVIENADEAGAITVPALPKAVASTPAAEAAPLNDAVRIEDEIRAGRGIQRLRHGSGWAWMRDGKILRTADRDGKNVAYFRPGTDKPFLVQRGGRAFAYDGDRPVREFDRDGRDRAPDAERAREANEAAREARDQRNRAGRARDNAENPENRWGGRRPDRERPEATPSPTPAPTASATPRGPRHPEWEGKGRPRPDPQ